MRARNIAQPIHVFSVGLDGRPRRPSLFHRYRRPAIILALLTPLVPAVLVAAWALKLFEPPPQEAARSAPALSIVVLPFADLSDAQGRQWFADGVTDDLITDLSRISGAFVIARSSAFTYQGKAVDVRQVARELDVRYVLEGSVRSSGEQVRVNATLVDGETGARIWSDRFDGDQRDCGPVWPICTPAPPSMAGARRGPTSAAGQSGRSARRAGEILRDPRRTGQPGPARRSRPPDAGNLPPALRPLSRRAEESRDGGRLTATIRFACRARACY